MFRTTMFFTSDRNSWSESHVDIFQSTRNGAEQNAQTIADARAQLLGTNARIVGLRVSTIGSARDARLIDMGAPTLEAPNFTNPQVGQTTADSPHVAVLVRGTGTDSGGKLHQTRIFLSGVPDALITVRGSLPQFQATPQWMQRYTPYKNYLLNGYGFGITRTARTGQVQGLVISNVPPGEVGIRIDNFAPAPNVGDYVQLSGFQTLTGFTRPLKGKYQVSQVVQPTAPDTLLTVFLRGTGGIDPTSFAKLGTYRFTLRDYIAYGSLSIAGATHRDRGGSYGLQRGRSRTIKR